jgi:hypothetical protein
LICMRGGIGNIDLHERRWQFKALSRFTVRPLFQPIVTNERGLAWCSICVEPTRTVELDLFTVEPIILGHKIKPHLHLQTYLQTWLFTLEPIKSGHKIGPHLHL